MDGYVVELHKTFALRYTLVNEDGVNVLHIREADKLIDSGVVADIAVEVWVGIAPLLGSHTKHRHIEHICFLCINDARLHWGHLLRNQMALDGIGMNTVVDF